MSSNKRSENSVIENAFKKITEHEEQKLKAKKEKKTPIWFGLGMFGLIGWSVALPMIIGVMIGLWLDRHFPGRFSWTLTMLLVGAILGCLNAWKWIRKELGHD